MAKLKVIDDSNFAQTVLQHVGPVLVEFTAPWCNPCKMLDPVLEELNAEYSGRILFTSINTDENYDAAIQYGVQNMPTMVLFEGGREVQRLVGYTPKAKLKQQIDRAFTAVPASPGRAHG